MPRIRSLSCAGILLLAGAGGLSAQAPDSPGPREAVEKARQSVTEALWGIQPSAFGDALSGFGETGQREFRWNAAELDLSKDFHEDLQASAAVVWTPGTANLTVGFLDYHPFGGMIAPRGRLWVEKGFHIQAGRFDVPFGNDWQFFASKDSASITRPLTTDQVMDGGYNDAGIRILGNNGTVNFNAFVLRGFSRGHLMGGRLGLTPFGNPFSLKGAREPKTAEFGLSWLYDVSRDGRKAGVASAADAELRMDPWTLRAEYLSRTEDPADGTGQIARHGWHFTQELTPGGAWPTFFLRYERAVVPGTDPDLRGGPQSRWAGGCSATFWGILQAKLEGQRYLATNPALRESPGFGRSRVYLQLVLVL